MTTSIDRVREVIAESGMSQTEFAAAVGLDAPKLSKSLTGIRRFTSSDVAHIAEVGHVSVDWLLGGAEPPLATAARRAAGSESAPAVAEAERLAELRSVATDLGFPLPTAEPMQFDGKTTRQQGETLAEAALGRLPSVDRLTSDDLASQLEEVFALDVAITDLGAGFDGLAAHTPQARLILANETPYAARQRFTMAHELAHLLAEDNQDVHLDQDVFAASDSSEVRANAFAAAFLMPDALLRDRVGRGFDEKAFAALVVDLKVSPSALAIRLSTVNLIDKVMASAFKRMTFAEAAKASGRSDEVAAMTSASGRPRPPARLARDLFAAYSAGVTTLRPYAAALGQNPREVRAALEAQDGDG